MSHVGLLIGGVQKSGTTTLHYFVSQLQGVAPPTTKKELHFFDNESLDWSAPDYGRLHAPFASLDPDWLWYESTPITIYWPGALERVRAYNPDMKLIFIFRDPVRRAFSHWARQWAQGREDHTFKQAILAEDERLNLGPGHPNWRRKSYRRRGRYGEQLERALKIFDRDQMLLLTLDELMSDSASVLRRIAAFTGTRLPEQPQLDLHLNARLNIDVPSRLEDDDIAFLSERLRDDMALFASLSNLDISTWLACTGPC